jgi:uncharacterized Zn finger protein (UPF0148 family)
VTALLNKSAHLDIPCPGCKRKKSFTVAELEKSPVYVCPGCGKSVKLQADDFRKGIADVEKQLRKFKDSFK